MSCVAWMWGFRVCVSGLQVLCLNGNLRVQGFRGFRVLGFRVLIRGSRVLGFRGLGFCDRKAEAQRIGFKTSKFRFRNP